ncbi:MAG TPA: ABC transporter permease [Gaiellaceae bacterium]|jgi:ABC-2 type transport system permease protein
MTLELARYPAYVVPTLVFPSVFFLFFALPGDASVATERMATFAGFAAIGVAFFQFGVGIAVERASPWEAYLRTLPIGVAARLGARVLSAALFAAVAAGGVLAVAVATTDASLTPLRWLGLGVALLVGTVPFALLGIALGYWVPERGALPIANLLYLSLAYAGGLWIRPDDLPSGVQNLSRFLPTRGLSDALVATLQPALAWRSWLALLGFGALFGLLAVWGYRRDEGRRFR